MDRQYKIKKIIQSGLLKEYDVLDMSFINYRYREVERGFIHKQMTGGISPCIKTCITNYGVVLYE